MSASTIHSIVLRNAYFGIVMGTIMFFVFDNPNHPQNPLQIWIWDSLWAFAIGTFMSWRRAKAQDENEKSSGSDKEV
jgi:hypothetical protein